MDSARMHELFARSIAGPDPKEDNEAWAAICELQLDGSLAVFEYAAAWLAAPEAIKRAQAASILGQMQGAHRPSSELLVGLLHEDEDPMVLASALAALGHLADPGTATEIARFRHHADEDVRFDAAFALGSMANDPVAVACLIGLTRDPSAKVRDWAAFGLGCQGQVDTPEVREALWRCLDDSDEEVREEAAAGLARRGEPHMAPIIRAWLAEGGLTSVAREAVAGLLRLEELPAEWSAADCLAALQRRFPENN